MVKPQAGAAGRAADGLLLQQDELVRGLQQMSDQVLEVVPDCIGMSVALLRAGVAYTLVATDAQIAVLDGIQYLDGGPCVETLDPERATESHPQDDPADGRRWELFAQSSAARDVRSTLTVPVLVEDELAGSVNVYAAGPHSFDGCHQTLTEVVESWAPAAVGRAHLSLSTRIDTERSGSRLQELRVVDRALEILQARQPVDRVLAAQRLRWAAVRAGLSEAELAAFIVEAHEA